MYPSSSTINICNFIYNSPIPSPPMQYEEHILSQHIHTLLLQQHLPVEDNFDITVAESTIINNNNNNEHLENFINNTNNKFDDTMINAGKKNKKCSKKDRHSKIHTAHGPRDRRMRLSLDVARKFFDLQDMLGFDKASKTVDWLLMKSRSAIKDLKQQKHSSTSSTSECEAVSGVLDQEFEPPMGDIGVDGKLSMPTDGNKEKKAKPGRVRAAFHPLAKESRNKARERARERVNRARERAKMKTMLCETQACLHEMGGHNVKTNYPSDQVMPPAAEELASHIHEHTWSLPGIFHYHQNPPATSHEHQFADFQFSGKFWEGYNNGNL